MAYLSYKHSPILIMPWVVIRAWNDSVAPLVSQISDVDLRNRLSGVLLYRFTFCFSPNATNDKKNLNFSLRIRELHILTFQPHSWDKNQIKGSFKVKLKKSYNVFNTLASQRWEHHFWRGYENKLKREMFNAIASNTRWYLETWFNNNNGVSYVV